jgi:hypothetical protein
MPIDIHAAALIDINAVMDAVEGELDASRDALKNSRPADEDEGTDAGEGTVFEKLPAALINLLHFPNLGASVSHGKYGSRSELLYAFITSCLRARASAKTISAACLDETYRGCAIYEHSKGSGGSKYVVEQIRHAKEDLKKELDDEVATINKTHALVLAGDKACVMLFEKVDGRDQFRLLKTGAFKQWFSNRHVTVGQKLTSVAEHWLKHPERRQYQGIEFAPVNPRDGYYNLWGGFAVESRAGSCDLFLAHLKDNVARGDEAHLKWIVGWFAQIMQQPHIKVGTSLVFRGKQGTGKTIVGQVFGSLIGEHYELVSDPRYITGQFNSHMASLLILHADEAFWGGDKRAEGKLKDLITGYRHRLEFKGIDPILVNNYMRLFVTSNAEWVVPAAFGERRFACFDVGEGRLKDRSYFGAIVDEMNRGGREALLHHLLTFDLSQVDLGKIPETDALLEQIFDSATPEQQWWLDTLRIGQLPRGTGVQDTCPKRLLFRRYIKHAQIQGVRRRAIETKIGRFLNKFVGPDLRSDEKKAYTIYFRGDEYNETGWIYRFPKLKDCRDRFSREIQQTIDWGPDAETAQWTHEPVQVEDEHLPF